LAIRDGYAVSVVLASQGYPGKYAIGKRIEFNEVPSSALYVYRTWL
jgi:phosphoribosylamine--glycine ligase/phosphoribosylformylglycinamidine cyclo-ligase